MIVRALPLLLLGLAACHTGAAPDAGPVAPSPAPTTPAPAEASTFRGLYAQGFEVSAFRPCDEAGQWWVSSGGELAARYDAVAPKPYDPVYAVVTGTTGPEGRYGHMGAYSRELQVTGVVEVRRPEPGECGHKPPPAAPPP